MTKLINDFPPSRLLAAWGMVLSALFGVAIVLWMKGGLSTFALIQFGIADFAVASLDVYSRRTRSPVPESKVEVSSDGLEAQSAATPGVPEFVITLLLPKRRAEAMLGDLAETFQRNIASRFGEQKTLRRIR